MQKYFKLNAVFYIEFFTVNFNGVATKHSAQSIAAAKQRQPWKKIAR